MASLAKLFIPSACPYLHDNQMNSTQKLTSAFSMTPRNISEIDLYSGMATLSPGLSADVTALPAMDRRS